MALPGTLNGQPAVIVAFEFEFMGGSMGSVVGEKFVCAANLCLEEQIPLICFSASGGARMQEALFSLMQMARTSAVLKKLKQMGVPYISVMTDPVYGGVSASLAMLGDINIAEPNALIGFAGPRVIEQTVRQTLPEGFQRSEFLLEHGVLDMIVHRKDLKERLAQLLSMLAYKLPAYQALYASEHSEPVAVGEAPASVVDEKAEGAVEETVALPPTGTESENASTVDHSDLEVEPHSVEEHNQAAKGEEGEVERRGRERG